MIFVLYVACLIALCNTPCIVSMDNKQPLPCTGYDSFLIFPIVTTHQHPKDQKKPIEDSTSYKPLSPKRKASLKSIIPIPAFISTDDRMKNMYDQASQLICAADLFNKDTSKFILMTEGCIDTYNKIKKYNIDEDQLGAFAFKQQGMFDQHAGKIALFFGLVKHYNKMLATTNDEKVLIHSAEFSPLAQSFNLLAKHFDNAVLVSQPMKSLVKDIVKLHGKIDYYVHMLVALLYGGNTLEQNNSSFIVPNVEWKKDFLYEAFSFVCKSSVDAKIVDSLLAKIDQAKNKIYLREEAELSKYVLGYKTTASDSIYMKPLDTHYGHKKGKISLLCRYIGKYNSARGSKVTPTKEDMRCYSLIKNFSIALPDAFDSRLLDDNHVAFKEYKQLIYDINILMDSADDNEAQCIKAFDLLDKF